MFKSPSALSLAVRLPDGKLHTESKPFVSISRRLYLNKIPLLRGIAIFIEMLWVGVSYLNKSATLAMDDADSEKLAETKNSIGKNATKSKTNSITNSTFVMTSMLVLSFLLSTAVALFAFKFLPLELAAIMWNRTTSPTYAFTITEGLIKLLIFIIYLVVIGQLKDVRRVFQYHGAEHKVIRTFEAGKKLNVKNVGAATRYHPRCGTSFLVFVILLSIILYSFIPIHSSLWHLFLIRIALLPVLVAISYEVLYLTAAIKEKSFWSFLLAPGFFVQSLTTREPNDGQIQVAIAAFNACKSKTK